MHSLNTFLSEIWKCIVGQQSNWHIPFSSSHPPLSSSLPLTLSFSLRPFQLFLVLVFLCTEGRHKWVWVASSALCPPVHQHTWQLQVHLPTRTPPAGRWQVLRWARASAQLRKLFVRLSNISILHWTEPEPTVVPQFGFSQLPLLHSHLQRAPQEPQRGSQRLLRAKSARLSGGFWTQRWPLLR